MTPFSWCYENGIKNKYYGKEKSQDAMMDEVKYLIN